MSRDPGLQPERTALAWSRTVLALFVGPLVALHLLPAVLGGVGVALGVAGLTVAAVVALLSARRVRGVADAIVSGGPLPGGVAMALCSAAIAAAAATLLVLAVLRWR